MLSFVQSPTIFALLGLKDVIGYFKMNIKKIFVALLCCGSFLSFAQEAEVSTTAGYISEDLIVYMHTGAGKNYRILGTVNSGEKVQLTGQSNNDYTQIITNKARTGWIESKHVSTEPGMRYVIADLNEKLASFQSEQSTLSSQLNDARSEVDQLKSERISLQDKISKLNVDLTQTKSQLKNQDTDIKKQWFFNGAMVLGIGLLLGALLPRLIGRKRKTASWT